MDAIPDFGVSSVERSSGIIPVPPYESTGAEREIPDKAGMTICEVISK